MFGIGLINLIKLLTVHCLSSVLSSEAAKLELCFEKNPQKLWLEPGAAGSGSKYANHWAMLLPFCCFIYLQKLKITKSETVMEVSYCIVTLSFNFWKGPGFESRRFRLLLRKKINFVELIENRKQLSTASRTAQIYVEQLIDSVQASGMLVLQKKECTVNFCQMV